MSEKDEHYFDGLPVGQVIARATPTALLIDSAVLAYAKQCCEGEVRTIPDANAGQRFARELVRLAALAAPRAEGE